MMSLLTYGKLPQSKGEPKLQNTIHKCKTDYICEYCNKRCLTKHHLIRHSRVHTGEKPYVCEICDKGYLTKYQLKVHCRFHTGEMPYVCEICNKRFPTRYHLKSHCRVHTGERPYVCLKCNRGFSYNGNLQKHNLIHMGLKRHICHICKMRFTQKHTLKVHYLTHTREKNHVCEFCNKAFSLKHILNTHYNVHISRGEIPPEKVADYIQKLPRMLSKSKKKCEIIAKDKDRIHDEKAAAGIVNDKEQHQQQSQFIIQSVQAQCMTAEHSNVTYVCNSNFSKYKTQPQSILKRNLVKIPSVGNKSLVKIEVDKENKQDEVGERLVGTPGNCLPEVCGEQPQIDKSTMFEAELQADISATSQEMFKILVFDFPQSQPLHQTFSQPVHNSTESIMNNDKRGNAGNSRKRKRENPIHESLKNSQKVIKSASSAKESDHMLFFRSLLPFVENFNTEQTLEFRKNVINILKDMYK